MADSFLQAPADGVGKKLDTRTEGTNSEHRQVVVLGDPATNAGVAPVDATNGLKVDAGTVVSSITAGVKLLDTAGVNQGKIDTHGSMQATLVDSSGNAIVSNANQTADYAKSIGTQPVMLPKDQAIPLVATAQANGTTVSRVVSAATTNATNLKASAGNIFGMQLFNVAAYDIFVKFYNKATAPTVGTDTPIWTVPIKTGTGFSHHHPIGLPFATGISYAITKLQADSDTTAVAASDVTGIISWI